MLDGPPATEITAGFAPPIEIKAPQHFTPLDVDHFANQRYEKPTITEPQKHGEPIATMSP